MIGRVLVCGGRDFTDRAEVFRVLDCYQTITEVIHGGARGTDALAGAWAEANGIPVSVFKADWRGLGKKAGVVRNQEMLDYGKPDMVIAFPGGKGTADMVRRAERAGVLVEQVKEGT